MSDLAISVERSPETGTLKSHLLNGSLRLLFLSLFLLFPFHEVFYHFVVKNRIGAGSVLFYPEHLLLIFLAVVFRRDLVYAMRRWRLEMTLLALYASAFLVSSLLNPVDPGYAFQTFVTSIVLPALLLLLLTVAADRFGFDAVDDVLLFLFTGMAAACAIGLAAYPASFGFPRDFHQFVYDFRTGMALGGFRAGVWYGDLTAGNFNVFAANLLPGAFLVYGWFISGSGRRPRAGLAAALLLLVMAANLYICYSRGSILVLNAGTGLFALAAWRLRTRGRPLTLLAAGVLAFDVLALAPSGAADYWTSATRTQAENSVKQRIRQWEEVTIKDLASSGQTMEPRALATAGLRPAPARRSAVARVLLGRGVGTYGVSRGLTASANTHNLFLNQYVATGVWGFLAFVGLFLVVIFRGWFALRAGDPDRRLLRLGGLVGLVAIALIGIVTQYEFSYLGTITGGALFWTCVFVSTWKGRTGAMPLPLDEQTREPGDGTLEAFALSVYPVSQALRMGLGLGDARPVPLSELRGRGVAEMLRSLRRVRAGRGVAVVEDPTMAPLAPILLLLLAITRCRTLQLAGPAGDVKPVRRASVLRWCWEIVSATLGGLIAVARQWALSVSLLRQRRVAAGPGAMASPWLYLRTTLWGRVKAGGSVGHIAGVINALLRRRIDVTVLAADFPPMVAAGAAFRRVPALQRIGFPYEFNDYRLDGLAYRFLKRQGSALRPGVIYHRASRGSIVAVRLSRLFEAPLVLEYNGPEVWMANHWGRPLRLRWLTHWCENVNLRHAHLLVVVSEVLKAECLARGVDPVRVVVCPNGIDPSIFDPDRFSPPALAQIRKDLAIPNEAVVVGFLGTYGPWHGAEVFAEAARRLVASDARGEEGRPLYFLFIGDGLRMSAVRSILSNISASPVRFAGLVSQERAPAHLAVCDIVVSPHVANPDGSRFFGSPTKLFEYMAMGKAIAASDLEQIGEVLRESYRVQDLPAGPASSNDSRLAVLSPPGDVTGLVEAITFLALRPDFRRVLGRNAREEALKRYTWDSVAASIVQRLGDVLKSSRTA